MGETPQYSTLDNFPGSSSYSVVAPFAADIDTTSRGSVKYTQFTTSNFTQMDNVSSFIQSETGDNFNGTRMMVAEWSSVPQYNESDQYDGYDVGSADLKSYCTMCLHVNRSICQWVT